MPKGVYVRTEEQKKHIKEAMTGRPSSMKGNHYMNIFGGIK